MKINQLLGAALLVLAASCNHEDSLTSPLMREVTIVAESSRMNTRTAIDENGTDRNLHVLWVPGDKLGVFGSATANTPFTSTNTTAQEVAEFAGSMSGNDAPLYAYYPYAEGVTDARAVPVTIASEQTYNDASSIAPNDIKVASAPAQANGKWSFRFRPVAAMLRFAIDFSGMEAHGVASTEKLLSVSLEPDADTKSGEPWTGRFTIDATQTDSRLTPVTDEAESRLTLRFNGEEGVTMSGEIEAYAALAPVLKQGEVIQISLLTDKHLIKAKVTMQRDIEPAKCYDFPLHPAAATDENGLTVESTEEPVEPDLPDDIEETANCYMITATGAHSFSGTVMGNGDKGIIAGAGFHTASASIAPKSAKLLWQDVEGFLAEEVTLDAEGRVHYTALKNTGNAVIAVYSGENCTGNILWSRHIWGVGDTLPADEEYTNRAGAKFTVMDRTLGAHAIDSYYATLYQWGRKDPMPNSTTYYVDGTATDIEESYPVLNNDNASILTGIQHPGELINRPSNNNSDWLPAVNKYLWGDDKTLNSTNYPGYKYANKWLDGVTADEQKGWSHPKTIYDPSPAGYRVASKFTWTGFVNGNNGTNSTGSDELSYVNYTKYESGYYFKKNADDTAGSYYPMTGSRGAATGSLWVGGNAPYSTLNYTATYWSASPGKTSQQAHSMQLTPYAPDLQGKGGQNSVNTIIGNYNANAFAIRCAREK